MDAHTANLQRALNAKSLVTKRTVCLLSDWPHFIGLLTVVNQENAPMPAAKSPTVHSLKVNSYANIPLKNSTQSRCANKRCSHPNDLSTRQLSLSCCCVEEKFMYCRNDPRTTVTFDSLNFLQHQNKPNLHCKFTTDGRTKHPELH